MKYKKQYFLFIFFFFILHNETPLFVEPKSIIMILIEYIYPIIHFFCPTQYLFEAVCLSHEKVRDCITKKINYRMGLKLMIGSGEEERRKGDIFEVIFGMIRNQYSGPGCVNINNLVAFMLEINVLTSSNMLVLPPTPVQNQIIIRLQTSAKPS